MKNLKKIFIALTLAFSFGVGFIKTTPVRADEGEASITLKNWPVNGTTFDLYKIADLNGSDYTAVNKSYAEYIDGKDLGSLKASESEDLAKKIAKVTEDKKIKEDASIAYGTNNTFSNLSTGLYLLKGEVSKKGETTYTPQVSLVTLPTWDGDTRVYSLAVEPKYEKTEPSPEPTATPTSTPTATPKPTKTPETTNTPEPEKSVITPEPEKPESTSETVIPTKTIEKKSEPVNTGDHSHVVMYSVIAAGSIAVIILIIVLRKRTREE